MSKASDRLGGAVVGVVDHLIAALAAAPERHDQGIDNDAGAPAGAHRPADDLLGAQVLDPGEVVPALVGGELGDVGHPAGVGTVGGEVALQQINGRRGPGLAGAPLPAAVDTDQPLRAHQPGHPFATGPLITPDQLAVDPRGAIGAARVGMDLPNQRQQLGVTAGTRTRVALAAAPLVS